MSLLDVFMFALCLLLVGVICVLVAEALADGRQSGNDASKAARDHAEKQVLALLAVVDHCRQSMLDDREQYWAAMSQVLDGAREEREVLYRQILANSNPVALRALQPVPERPRRSPLVPPPEPYIDDLGEAQEPIGLVSS